MRVSVTAKLSCCLLLLLFLPVPGQAQVEDDTSAFADDVSTGQSSMDINDIARELSQPATSLSSYKLGTTFRTFSGSLPGSSDQNELIINFEPTIPINLSNGKNIIIRANIPMHQSEPEWRVDFGHPIWQVDQDYTEALLRQSPQVTPDSGHFRYVHGHMGDIGFDVAYGGVSDNGFISMYGIAGAFPTTQNISGDRNQALVGPELAFGKSADWGVAGAWLKHLVNVGGAERFDTNETTVEVFFAYELNNGWQLISNPTIAYDWEADNGNELLLPVGGGVAKTTFIGNTPWRFALEVQYYVVTPDRFGPEWALSFNLAPAFGNLNLIKR